MPEYPQLAGGMNGIGFPGICYFMREKSNLKD
jgi:hypothetical protein